MTVVYIEPTLPVGPGTYVLAIGIDRYPYLLGGDPAKQVPEAAQWGFAQLTAAAPSARAIATWFIDEHVNPAAPVASVALLLSEAAPAPFRPKRGVHADTDVPIQAATMTAVQDAIVEWKNRLDSHEDNIGVLYFCGHGMEAGGNQYLITETFGSNANSKMRDAVYLTGLFPGMDTCLARKQLFLIDACRNAPTALVERIKAGGGGAQGADPVIEPTGLHPTNRTRDAGMILATAGAGSAYAPTPGRPSRFASALLRAFRGAGWDDLDGPWTRWMLRSDSLLRHLRYLMKVESDLRDWSLQDPACAANATFVLHEPPPGTTPRIPVVARAANGKAARVAVIANGAAPYAAGPAPTKPPWELEVTAAQNYQIVATFDDNTSATWSFHARPTLCLGMVEP